MSSFPVRITNLSTCRSMLSSISTVIFDMDGTIWNGNEEIKGSTETLNKLIDNDNIHKVLFYTNNSAKTRSNYLVKLKQVLPKLHINSHKIEIITSASLTGEYLCSNYINRKWFVIGSESLKNELSEEHHLTIVNSCPYIPKSYIDMNMVIEDEEFTKYVNDADGVIIGHDVNFSFEKLCMASCILQKQDSIFIATNCDASMRLDKWLIPGNGTFVNSIEFATGRQPDVIVGKPNVELNRWDIYRKNDNNSMTSTSTNYEEMENTNNGVLMVGDRIQTDIYFGNRLGAKTLIVGSGVEDFETGCLKCTDADFAVEDIGVLAQYL